MRYFPDYNISSLLFPFLSEDIFSCIYHSEVFNLQQTVGTSFEKCDWFTMVAGYLYDG